MDKTKPQTQTNKTTTFYNELQELKAIEVQVAKKISPTLLDYMFLFAPDVTYNIKISSLSKEGEGLLKLYINKADAFLTKLNLPINKPLENIVETFVDKLHDMYMLRFIDAKLLYAEYEFFRIPTRFETALHEKSLGSFKVPEETTSFIFPDSLVLDKTNDIDWEKSLLLEKTEHTIARNISAYKNARILQDQMFNDLEAITTRAFAFMIIKKELQEVINEVLHKVFFFFSGEVYKYINKNYGLEESVSNVYEYYKESAEKGPDQFVKTLKKLFTEIDTILEIRLSAIPEMNATTKEMLIDDFRELITAYFLYKMVFPKDYYEAQIRDHTEFYENEKGFNYLKIIDLFMYIPEGGVTEMALESFVVDFSDGAKFFIFKAVVGDVENPVFTLKDYLRQE